jgi:hypothetical protein
MRGCELSLTKACKSACYNRAPFLELMETGFWDEMVGSEWDFAASLS